jgi:hypothetical protein
MDNPTASFIDFAFGCIRTNLDEVCVASVIFCCPLHLVYLDSTEEDEICFSDVLEKSVDGMLSVKMSSHVRSVSSFVTNVKAYLTRTCDMRLGLNLFWFSKPKVFPNC